MLYEGLLTNIERKIQLFQFVKRGCYNVRAVGSLNIENFFGTFQELDPRGSGVLTLQDIPSAISVAIELLDAKFNPTGKCYFDFKLMTFTVEFQLDHIKLAMQSEFEVFKRLMYDQNLCTF